MAGSERRGLLTSVGHLTMVMVAGWVLCYWPARLLRGQAGVIWMTIAAVCCLVPGWIVVLMSSLAVFPNDLAAMLAQTAVRLATAGGAAVAVKVARPEIGAVEFYGWLILFYLLAQITEVVLLRRNAAAKAAGGASLHRKTETRESSEP